MNEDYAEDDLDFSGVSDDELLEIVNSRFGCYRQEVIDGAENELKKRGGDNARVESSHQVMVGEVHPPVLLENVSGSKLFSAGQITLATFLGTPIAGCLLLAQNYRELEDRGAAWQSLAWGVALTVLLLFLAFWLPENFPSMALPVACCFAMQQLTQYLQGGAISEHQKAGGRKGSWAIPIIAGVGSLVLIFILIIGVLIVLNIS